ncbi:MAG TPA: zinc ribbon domain-containing protein, partial [Polyangiaceae bacterium]|nr:zinc ribbon domain-containing protein [Polyangiaceae bacterium]
AKKLLGLTHRHCPNCGAQQDPNARYFPADHEKVAVQNHEFVGADIKCRYCGGPSSRRARNCGQCGAPLAEGAQVEAQTAPQPSASLPLAGAESLPPPRSLWKIFVPIATLGAVAVVVVLLLWKKEQAFVVASHSWRRSVSVERMGPVHESAWCSALPAAASEVSRRREQHGVKQVPDGEDCKTHKQDRGDGTFKEEQVCAPKYKDQPVYEDKCDYLVVRWSQARKATAEGAASVPPPQWPAVVLGRAACSSVGCEREGARDESYTVVFRDAKGENYRCDLPQPAWSSFAEGARYSGKLRLVGSLDCSSLVAAR